MSTLELEHLKHSSSSTNNLSVHSDGSLTLGMLQGNVGIGTSSPTVKLEAVGDIKASVSGANAQISAITDGPSNYATFTATTGARSYSMQVRPDQGNAFTIRDETGGGNRLLIDTAGRVITPGQPAWFYTGGTSLTTGAYVVTKPGTAVISSSNYSTSTGLFTAPIAGKYLVGVEGLLYAHSSDVYTNRWQKNGALYGNVIQTGGENNSHTHISWTQLVDLAQNDTIGFAMNRGGGSANAYGSQWHQWGYLLG